MGGALAGLTVLVTRPREQAEALSDRLRAHGARVLETPTIRIADPPDPAPLAGAVARLEGYDWVVLTSVNGVRKLLEAVGEGGALAPLRRARLAAIGPATAKALEAAGLRAEVVPERYRAEALRDAILAAAAPEDAGTGDPARPLAGVRILLPRAAEARETLPRGLMAAGATVDEVPAYFTLPDERDAAPLRAAIAAGRPDWVTFTSSSTVRNYVSLVGADTGGAAVAAIGPVTAGTARELGLEVRVVAREYTIPGLVRALVAEVTSADDGRDAGGDRGEANRLDGPNGKAR